MYPFVKEAREKMSTKSFSGFSQIKFFCLSPFANFKNKTFAKEPGKPCVRETGFPNTY
jgi:hypothetical protein